MISSRSALIALALVSPTAAPSLLDREGIHWEADAESALTRAKEAERVVFVAVNFDGERACDRLAEKVYRDPAIVALARSTLNLVASPSSHATGERACTRFDGLVCADHQRVDVWTRKAVLKPDSAGYVVAPHHVFLDSKGKVILSVPYEVEPSELAWCFVTALKLADPKSKAAMPASARAPRRLLLGGVLEPSSEGAVGPATREEVLRLVKEVKKELPETDKTAALHRILSSDEPEGVDYIRAELRSGGSYYGGGGGQSGGSGGGQAGGSARGGGRDERGKLLHSIGALSPPSYWEVAADFAVGTENAMRHEAAVALEQLAAPESVKTIQNALFKEDHKEIKKDWIRALAAAGSADARVRKDLLKRVTTEKDELLQLNTIVALGSLAPGDDVGSVLGKFLREGTAKEKGAAACAMAISRDPRWLADLETAAAQPGDPQVQRACSAAVKALRHGGLLAIRETLKEVASDEIERDRWFGFGP